MGDEKGVGIGKGLEIGREGWRWEGRGGNGKGGVDMGREGWEGSLSWRWKGDKYRDGMEMGRGYQEVEMGR